MPRNSGSGSGGSPNQVLIIFLVFFVLVSIVLGVTTYLGYDGQTQLKADAKTAKDDVKKREADVKWYRFQALLLRQVVGETLNNDDKTQFSTLAGEYASDDLSKNTSDPRKNDATNTVKTVLENPNLYAQGDANKPPLKQDGPKTNFQTLLDNQQRAFDTRVAGELKKVRDDLVVANQRAIEAEAARDKARKDLADGLKTATENTIKNAAKLFDDTKTLQDRLGAVGIEMAKLTDDMGNLGVEHAKKVNILNKEIKSLKDAVALLESKTATSVNIFDYDQPKGKIVKIDATGTMPYINLGRLDNLKAGVTFSVYGVGLDGKPIAYDIVDREGKTLRGPDGKTEKEGKATVEVLAVVGDHQSQVRVTSVRDPNRDPIVPNDLLFNPAWNPLDQQHIAVVGLIDLSGDGRDEMAEFLRMMEKNRVIVDAYLDLREIAIKGEGVTRRTDFLVLGPVPSFAGEDRVKEDDPRAKRRDDIIKEMTKLQDEAAKNGVTVISLRKFLMLSGFRAPKSIVGSEAKGYRPPMDNPAPPKP
jgi:hypothetical protein